jgi:hypothetical protein
MGAWGFDKLSLSGIGRVGLDIQAGLRLKPAQAELVEAPAAFRLSAAF